MAIKLSLLCLLVACLVGATIAQNTRTQRLSKLILPAQVGSPLVGPCNNSNDLSVFNSSQSTFHGTLQHCATGCWGDASCTSKCLVTQTHLTSACADCFGADAACSAKNCAAACILDPTGSSCLQCSRSHCQPALYTCTGVDPSIIPP